MVFRYNKVLQRKHVHIYLRGDNLRVRIVINIMLVIAAALCFTYSFSHAEHLKIAIMQDQEGAAIGYQPLVPYFKSHGIDVSFVKTSNYLAAVNICSLGKVDAMFSGSGVAGSMIIKEVAVPVVRPLGKSGTSTYWAVILASKGTAKYSGSADYFKGKKATFCSLASSGEFYFRSIGGHKTARSMIKAASHWDAIDTLSRGVADVAVVSNRVWDKIKDKYPDLEIVGSDTGANPSGTLIVSKDMNAELAEKITAILIGLMLDPSSEAKTVREEMNLFGYIKTTGKHFDHTLALLKNAGVTSSFDFKF